MTDLRELGKLATRLEGVERALERGETTWARNELGNARGMLANIIGVPESADDPASFSVIGWVVLTNDVKDGPPKWEPDWDGQVHTDKERADAELANCRGVGYECVLGEVRVAES